MNNPSDNTDTASSSSAISQPGRIKDDRDSDLCQTSEIPRILPLQIDNLNSKRIGRGTYGHVEKTRFRPSIDGDYTYAAVKYANDDDYRRSLIREAKIMMRLRSHQSVIKIYGIYVCPLNGPGVVMEFMDCGNLAELIFNRDIQYKIDHFVSWMHQLASAVDFFHSNNTVHRDLKLQNMLLCNRYKTMKLCDFGTLTAMHSSMTANRGTPITMAPEIFRGSQYDTKSDIFSIGIIMWQLITRRNPYDRIIVEILLWNVAQCQLRPCDIPCNPILSRFYKKCWHDDPNVRPTSAETLEYFTILKKEFPNSDEPLFSKSENRDVCTPQPSKMTPSKTNDVLSKDVSAQGTRSELVYPGHRRAGSDQTSFINKLPVVSNMWSMEEPAGLRGTRSKSVAVHERPERPPPAFRSRSTDDETQFSLPEELDEATKPVEPDVRDAESMRIFSEHQSERKTLEEVYQLKMEVMRAKHETQTYWEYLKYRKILLDRMEYLKTFVDQVSKEEE